MWSPPEHRDTPYRDTPYSDTMLGDTMSVDLNHSGAPTPLRPIRTRARDGFQCGSCPRVQHPSHLVGNQATVAACGRACAPNRPESPRSR